MHVVVEKRIVDQCLRSRASWGVLLGQVSDGDVYRITGVQDSRKAPAQAQVLGVWCRQHAVWAASAVPGSLALVVGDGTCVQFRRRSRGGRLREEASGTIIDTERGLWRRLRGVVDHVRLQASTVVVVGCGSVGSAIARLLVGAGLGRIILMDRDRLDVHNIIRHECGYRDVGRFKVHALADRLRDINPHLLVECWPVDVVKERDVRTRVIRDCDLVVGTTDVTSVQLVINSEALAAGKPAVFAGAYNFGFGGEVIRVEPDSGPCLRCSYDAGAELFQREEPGDDGKLAPYDEDRGHPGMRIDVGIIAHLAARMVVETLTGANDPSRNLVGNYLLWGNWRLWAFREPLDHLWLSIPRNPGCPVCGGEDALSLQLAAHDLDRESAEALGRLALAPAGLDGDAPESRCEDDLAAPGFDDA